MARGILYRRVELGRAQPMLRIQEHRVVAEAAIAAGRTQDPAAPFALCEQRARIRGVAQQRQGAVERGTAPVVGQALQCPQQLRSEEHTSELQSRENLVCRLLLE